MSGLGALPARFRRPRVLIIGCGDVGQRVLQLLPSARYPTALALTSSANKVPQLRRQGVRVLLGTLDDAATLTRLAGIATHVLHLAPPAQTGGTTDARTWFLLRTLAKRGGVHKLVYGSTSGVYGDCAGEVVNELRPVNAQTPRAMRRVSAEQAVKAFGKTFGVPSTILRIPGIYAPNREGGTPKTRLEQGAPVLQVSDDVYTNHIHADDLARACVAALWGRANHRTVNVSDDSALKLGEYMDLAAALYGLPKPPRLSLAQAKESLSPMRLSFMQESRRLDNTRLKTELGIALRYPTPEQGLAPLR